MIMGVAKTAKCTFVKIENGKCQVRLKSGKLILANISESVNINKLKPETPVKVSFDIRDLLTMKIIELLQQLTKLEKKDKVEPLSNLINI